MRLLFSLLLLFQAALPALCLAGELDHICSEDCQQPGGCEHESDCPDDPCSQVSKIIGVKENSNLLKSAPVLEFVRIISASLSYSASFADYKNFTAHSISQLSLDRTYASKNRPLLV